MYGAQVAPQPGAVALHVFGTSAGSCPPGAALRAPGNRSAAGFPGPPRSRPGTSGGEGSLAEPPVGGNGSAGFLLSPNGTVIDISRNLLPGWGGPQGPLGVLPLLAQLCRQLGVLHLLVRWLRSQGLQLPRPPCLVAQ